MRIVGGGGGGGVQVPSLSSTETVFEPPLATTTSGRPSSLKSPTATAEGDEPTAYAPAYVRVPSPLPSSSLTVPVSASDVTASSSPSPLKSAAATPVSRAPLAEWLIGSSNVPSPRPRNTFTVWPAVTRSGMPSPVKSPTAIPRSSGPPKNSKNWSRNVPSPLPRSAKLPLPKRPPQRGAAVTASRLPSRLRSATVTAAGY